MGLVKKILWVLGALALSQVPTFGQNVQLGSGVTVGSAAVSIPNPLNTVSIQDKGGQVYNVKAYGAKGDGVVLYDGAMTGGTAVLTSVSGSPAPGDAGKLICVAGAGASGAQLCTTISSVNPGVSWTLSVTASTGVSGAAFAYATDDSAAFTAAFSAASTAGGVVYMPPGAYGTTAPIIFPTGAQVIFVGSGANRTVYQNASGTITGTAQTSGSALWFLTSSLGAPGITLNATNPWQFNNSISDMTIWAGAGVSRNGGGGSVDGIDILSPSTSLTRVIVGNFSGDGIKIYTGASTFNSLIRLDGVKAVDNGAAGIETALGVSGQFNQNILIQNGGTEFNGTYGIYLNGATDAVLIENQIIQENNLVRTSGLEEIFFNSVKAGTLESSWIESDDSSTIPVGVSANATAITISGNWFQSTVNAPISLGGPTAVKITGNNSNIAGFLTATSTSHLATIDNTNRMTGDGGLGAFGKSFTGTSGTASGYENLTGGSITTTFFLNGYANTGAAQTWTFPVAYATTPILAESGGSCGAQNPSVSATVLTLPANAAMTAETCQVTVTGQQP